MDTAITRAVAGSIDRCELTFLPRCAIDYGRASEQHACYVALLRSSGLNVIELPRDDSLPDSCFVEDVAVIVDEIAIMASIPSSTRRREVATVEAVLAEYRPTIRLDSRARVEGGDVLLLGRTVFVGQSQRTNSEGYRALRELLLPYGYEVVPIAVHGCLHLKTACTAVAEDAIVVNPRWIDTHLFADLELTIVPDGEDWAANTLRVGDAVYVSSKGIRTAALLEERGITVRTIDISELQKAEAGLTCMSLLLSEKAR